MKNKPALLLAIGSLLMLATVSSAQVSGSPPRDVPTRTRGDQGKVTGRVVDAGTGLPIRRATVTLSPRISRSDPLVMSTDEQGGFTFVELPLGEYTLTARAGGYIPLGPGQRRPTDARRPVLLSPGHASEDIALELPKGGVIAGRVFDEFGQPVLGATVRAGQLRYSRGRARAFPTGNLAQTDDLGQFRLYGLATGTYVVTADLRTTFVGRNLDASGYAPSYHPGTAQPEEARLVSVLAPSESPADVTLAPVLLSSVSGVVLRRGSKSYVGGHVSAVRHQGTREFGALGARTGLIEADGSFTITALVPGEYVLFASLPNEDSSFPVVATDDVAFARVSVTEAPVVGITLEPGRFGVARGRVVIEGSVRPGALKGLQVTAEAPDEHVAEIDVPPVDVAADGSFELRGLFGRQLLSVDGANGVNLDVKAIRVDGEDVTDTGVIFAPGQVRDHIEIVLTSVRTVLKGIVQDEAQRPVAATVMLFSEDPSKWTSPTDAYVRRTKADPKGAFRFADIRPGEYLVLAVDDFDMATYGDPAVLERLRALGTRVEIDPGAEATMTVSLQRP